MSLKSWIEQFIGTTAERMRIAELKRQIHTLRAEVKAAAARVGGDQKAILHGEKAVRTAARDRAKLERSTTARKRMKRQMLSPIPLAGLIAARRLQAPAPAMRVEADSREARFKGASAAYAAALEQPWPRPGVAAIDIDGIRLWIPLDERQPERVARATAQDIPLGAILQSREVAIGGLMLDIGANLGRTSLPRALLGDVRAVYGAEADADNYACLVQAVLDNGLRGFVLPDHLAISGVDGTATLRRSQYVGGHRLLPGKHRDDLEVSTVRTRRVDTWVGELGIDPREISFVKVDVQGWEPGVLKGAPALLSLRTAAWQMEVDPHLLRVAGSSVADLVGLAQPHFTHFVDLRADAPGDRHRQIAELGDALGYLPADKSDGTDVIFYNAGDVFNDQRAAE